MFPTKNNLIRRFTIKTNTKSVNSLITYGGGKASPISSIEKLRRLVLSCLLFEDQFYKTGIDIAEEIDALSRQVKKDEFIELMLMAKNKYYLRHVPLWMAVSLTKNFKGKEVGDAIYNVINRADEIAEILALYWKNGKCPISAQLKKALARVFENKFNEYNFAKYNNGDIKLRDVMFLVHPCPSSESRSALLQKIAEDNLTPADTWENAISKCKTSEEKRIQWERLLSEKKLGAMALIRNLRNMKLVGVDESLIESALNNADYTKVFPFRFIAAAKSAPYFEHMLDMAMLDHLRNSPKLPGKTVIIVDVSGSMYGQPVSANSDMNRALAACSVGAIGRELCEKVSIYATAGNDHTRIHKTAVVPARHGMALVDAIYEMCYPLGCGGIFLNQVCEFVRKHETGKIDRTIIITDEQDCSGEKDAASKANPLGKGYIINVSAYECGIGYNGKWEHIHGWSEGIFKYILEYENLFNSSNQ